MKDTSRYTPKHQPTIATVPFEDAAEAWFWFIMAQQAREDGARFASGVGLVPRPCEPADILSVLNQLYRGRRLSMDHLLVLRHYGRRQMAPEPTRIKEMRAHDLWREAMERIEDVLMRKGIVEEKTFFEKLRTPMMRAHSTTTTMTFERGHTL